MAYTALSIFFSFYRKETCVFLQTGVKILLRKEKCFLLQHFSFHRQRHPCKGMPTKKERNEMSNKNNNQINVPQAREAMDRFKMQAAQDLDVFFTS